MPPDGFEGSKLGTLCLIDREPRDFDEDDLALLRDLARMVEQELAAVQLATMDELTMLSNRRGFEALSKHALGLCKRLHRPACMFFFDLNYFKPINDRFGHAEGDHALINFAQILTETFRESDVVGRLGGDEFAVLLTNATSETSQIILDRFSQKVDEYNKVSQRGYDILYSVGMVKYDAARHKDVSDLMAEADTLMYEHKKRSRSERKPVESTSIARQSRR